MKEIKNENGKEEMLKENKKSMETIWVGPSEITLRKVVGFESLPLPHKARLMPLCIRPCFQRRVYCFSVKLNARVPGV